MKKTWILVIAVLMVAGVSTSVYALPYVGADIEFAGKNYSDISKLGTTVQSGGNEWYVEGDAIWTAWANQWVEYTANLTEGNWNIGLNVINHGNLGSGWYSQFEVLNSANNTKIYIPASDTEVNHGFVNVNIGIADAGDYTVRYTWKNDKYAPNMNPPQDANIQINSAFFDNTETAPVPEPSTMLLLGAGLIGVGVWRRKTQKR